MLWFLFNISTWASLQQIMDLLRNEGLGLAGSIIGELMVELVGSPFQRPFVLVSSHRGKGKVTINKVITPIIGFFLGLLANGRVDGHYLQLAVYTMGIGKALAVGCRR